MIIYLIIMYIFIAFSSYLGQINKEFDANFLQQVGLALAGFWCIWRAHMLITGSAYGHPHEPVVVTFIGLVALGTMQKTLHYCRRKRKIERFIKLRRVK